VLKVSVGGSTSITCNVWKLKTVADYSIGTCLGRVDDHVSHCDHRKFEQTDERNANVIGESFPKVNVFRILIFGCHGII